ncbi:hypothetical protein [Peribacillus sp. NPDC097295]|uniref:hypothetical protein n=1 Tax=Peribacillus sp. NPDC097295 TaxID=3364402 RepID=UPI0037F5DA98
MAIAVALLISILGSIVAHHLCKGKSKKRKLIIWGITTMVAIAPFSSFAIGLTYALIVRSGWGIIIMWYLFPIIFITGLVMLILGIFKVKRGEAGEAI